MFLAIRRGHRGDTSGPERGGMTLPARKVSVERLQLATFHAPWQEPFRECCSLRPHGAPDEPRRIGLCRGS